MLEQTKDIIIRDVYSYVYEKEKDKLSERLIFELSNFVINWILDYEILSKEEELIKGKVFIKGFRDILIRYYDELRRSFIIKVFREKLWK